MSVVNITIKEDFLSFSDKIKQSKFLNPAQKLILYTLYSYKDIDIKNKLLDKLITDTSLPASDVKKSLYCLIARGWLVIENKFCRVQQPGKFKKGQKIAQIWPNIFGSLQLTPYSFRKIITYIDDGLEETLIIEILKMSADNAKGSPLNYCYAVLANLLEKEIYTLEDYYSYREERGENLEKQVSRGTKKDKERMERQTLSELYKKGYQ